MLHIMTFRTAADATETARIGKRYSPKTRIHRIGRILWWFE